MPNLTCSGREKRGAVHMSAHIAFTILSASERLGSPGLAPASPWLQLHREAKTHGSSPEACVLLMWRMCSMPGLGAMEKTVSIPAVQKFTPMGGVGEEPTKGPADSNPASTEREGKLRTLPCYRLDLTTTRWAWNERATGTQSHSQSLAFGSLHPVKGLSPAGAEWLLSGSSLPLTSPAFLSIRIVLAGLVGSPCWAHSTPSPPLSRSHAGAMAHWPCSG